MSANDLQAGALVEATLRELAAARGFVGCALVVADTGMVVLSAGPPEVVQIAEAASDHWRLHGRRHAEFAAYGAFRVLVSIQDRLRTTITRCTDGMLLVSLTGEPDSVDWAAWKRQVGRIGALVPRL